MLALRELVGLCRNSLAPRAANREAVTTVLGYLIRRLGWAVVLFLIVTLYT